jgi:hypothetical protein
MLKPESALSLLLTATVDVGNMPYVSVRDSAIRESQYISALLYYAKNHPRIRKIVFAENSGWPLDKIKAAVTDNPYRKEFEFISYKSNDAAFKSGKSYGEALIIDNAVENSALIKNSTHVAKLTGRLILTNITGLVQRVPDDCGLYCDLKEHNWIYLKLFGINKWASPYCDTRFFIFSKEFYRQFIAPAFQSTIIDVKGRFSLEHQMYHVANDSAGNQKIMNRFVIQPFFSGMAGHFRNKRYDSLTEMLKNIFLQAIRFILPWVHI